MFFGFFFQAFIHFLFILQVVGTHKEYLRRVGYFSFTPTGHLFTLIQRRETQLMAESFPGRPVLISGVTFQPKMLFLDDLTMRLNTLLIILLISPECLGT